nr:MULTISPECIES: beta family protein [Mesorhizobium]
MKDPVTGSVSWIRMASAHAGMVPVVRLVSAEAVTAQIEAANASGIAVAFRVDPEDQLQVGLAGRGLSALRQPGSAFLILDAGAVRNRVSSASAATESALRSLRNASGESFQHVRKALVSGSFPSSSLRDLPRLLPMEERLSMNASQAHGQVEYGDHASLPKRSARSGSNGWFPHVDLTLDGHWRIELEERNSDRTGYGRCALATVASGEWKSRTECWGTSVVKKVADGSTTVDGVKFVVPAAWLSVRANQHISRFARDR